MQMKPCARCKATQRNCQKSQLFSWQTYAILNLSYLSMGGSDLLCVAPLVNKNANEGRLTCFNWTFRHDTSKMCNSQLYLFLDFGKLFSFLSCCDMSDMSDMLSPIFHLFSPMFHLFSPIFHLFSYFSSIFTKCSSIFTYFSSIFTNFPSIFTKFPSISCISCIFSCRFSTLLIWILPGLTQFWAAGRSCCEELFNCGDSRRGAKGGLVFLEDPEMKRRFSRNLQKNSKMFKDLGDFYRITIESL